jgi:hypothetical protein
VDSYAIEDSMSVFAFNNEDKNMDVADKEFEMLDETISLG